MQEHLSPTPTPHDASRTATRSRFRRLAKPRLAYSCLGLGLDAWLPMAPNGDPELRAISPTAVYRSNREIDPQCEWHHY